MSAGLPGGLVGAGLVFWGWQTGFLPVGVALALALEARVLVTSRWDLARSDFNRVSDVSTVLLVLVGIYQVISNDVARAVTGIIQWLPLVVFPLVAAQRYSLAGRVETATFFWSQRNRPDLTAQIDLVPAYFGVCLLSASTANARPSTRGWWRCRRGRCGPCAAAPGPRGGGSASRWRSRSAGRVTSALPRPSVSWSGGRRRCC